MELLQIKLRYYDSEHDTTIKGIIDLSDVESVIQGSSYNQSPTISPSSSTLTSMPATTSKPFSNDNKCFFELKTSKRIYYFCARTLQDAYKWKEHLDACLDS
jgi:myotubularin-related protein 5/13